MTQICRHSKIIYFIKYLSQCVLSTQMSIKSKFFEINQNDYLNGSIINSSKINRKDYKTLEWLIDSFTTKQKTIWAELSANKQWKADVNKRLYIE